MTIKRVIAPFAIAGEDGAHRIFSAGDLIDTEDSAYAGNEHLFEELTVAMDRKGAAQSSANHPSTVERATAEPGELREVRPWAPLPDEDTPE